MIRLLERYSNAMGQHLKTFRFIETSTKTVPGSVNGASILMVKMTEELRLKALMKNGAATGCQMELKLPQVESKVFQLLSKNSRPTSKTKTSKLISASPKTSRCLSKLKILKKKKTTRNQNQRIKKITHASTNH